jgi:16S rRNA (cytosine967-C5)-methyltransferase
MSGQDVRVAAVKVMQQLHTGGGSLTRLLPVAQATVADADRALLQAMCFGMARWSQRLSGLVDSLLDKPLKRKDQDIYLLMQLGIYQLAHTRVAPHAAVDTTVAAVKKMGKPWAKGLVNAVLRNYQRQVSSLEDGLSESSTLAHPEWLLTHFQQDWPQDWTRIVEQNNQQAPMTLRVNQRHHTTEQYLALLEKQELLATPVEFVPSALVLEKATSVHALPGFADGHVSVQDGAAQIAASILGKGAGKRLLDACAAPGGKTAHALEFGDWQQVVALDQDAERLEKVGETLDRLALGERAVLQSADAANLDSWWDKQAFDAVLLDAPCSGTGVIRRHPDIKLLRRASDIDELVKTQQALMHALWSTLTPGGHMLYATCSIIKAENEHQVAWFAEQHSDASQVPLSIGVGRVSDTGCVQILPGEQGMDGFFYALLEKQSA